MESARETARSLQDTDVQIGGAPITAPTWLGGAVLVHANERDRSALEWANSHATWLKSTLRTRGAILLRGFDTLSVDEFADITTIAGGGEKPQPYENRSTPRHSVKGNIFTSTEYPPSETITLHNENSYNAEWPGVILFLCQQAALSGGETPIADSRQVYSSIPVATRSLFESKGITYVRNYGKLGLSWVETFQTTNKGEVESYCTRHAIEWKWTHDGGLQTRQTLPAVRTHPITGEPVWFNQAHLFHVSNLGTKGSYLLKALGSNGVPRNALFGDGSEIPASLLHDIRAIYEAHAIPLDWRVNDLAILDNMLWAHGRRPFSGERRVIVAMTKMIRGQTS
jgi:alpha-ketoglutarate-dependent taurine dioxygenase